MFKKLAAIQADFKEMTAQLASPELLSNPAEYAAVAKRRSELEEVVSVYEAYLSAQGKLDEDKQLLDDPDTDAELAEMAELEISELEDELSELEERLTLLLVEKNEEDDKNTIIEIRAGTGGEEAGLFAADLYRMYSRYAERNGWRLELMSMNDTGIGGLKEAIFAVQGKGAYGKFKFESGVHRVQRVPETEAGGRIHTSAATVAVLPEAEEVDVTIQENDIKIDVFRSSGPGGQSVNTTDSAVRLTHIPTGIVISCQDEKSQHKNKAKALRVLRAKLYELAVQEKNKVRSDFRKDQVGTGDRSERIRTYNFPQQRVTDHRIGLTLYRLSEIIDGDLDELINALAEDEAVKQLSS